MMISILNNYLITFFGSLLILGMIVYILRSTSRFIRKQKEEYCRKAIAFDLISGEENKKTRKKLVRHWKILLDVYVDISQNLRCGGKRALKIVNLMKKNRIDIKLIKKIMKGSVYQRSYAARYLGYLSTDAVKRALVVALEKETSEPVKLYLVNALVQLDISAAIPTLIDSLKGASSRYKQQVAGFILNFRSAFLAFFPVLSERKELEVQELIMKFAEEIPSEIFLEYLWKTMEESEIPEIKRQAFRCLLNSYGHTVDPVEFIHHSDSDIRELAIMGLANYPSKRSLRILFRILKIREYREMGQKSLSNLISQTPRYIAQVTEMLFQTQDPEVRTCLIHVTADRFEYFLPRIREDSSGNVATITREVLKIGYTSSLIDFLNNNKDRDIENILVRIIQSALQDDKIGTKEFQYYLNERILSKIGLQSLPVLQKRTNAKNESTPLGSLYILLIGAFLIYPIVFGISLKSFGDTGFWLLAVKESLNQYMIGFGIYGLILNGIYLVLFLLGFMNSQKQEKFRKLKNPSLLFQKGVLPSLSIIVPAYSEESTIIENVQSLLNLRYPDFELIVVNDGSPDDTLNVLIEHFQLRKEDRKWTSRLESQPIRGIYVNPHIPELTVIDKINGGKADTLNAGINFSDKEYFVGIDSDSLLERDSLLEVMGLFLDEEKPVIAAGGNIMPINGCTVSKGVLEKKHVSLNPLALFQTIEYLRSFMNGRMGWARLDSLLIISGAFGVFKREEVIEVGGYLTSSGRFLKDTVGEDMELVVRLNHYLTQEKRPFSVKYVASANCWTEVPVSLKILGRQRDRWQRGLLDILTFHKKMMFNPKYKGAGLLALPYYLIFETLGPWFEIQATFLLMLGLILGWLSPSVLLFILIANFAISAFLSLSAMLIADWNGSQFNIGDRLLLGFASFAETLGFRQLMSFYRISGYINTLKKKTGWGKMTRQGFKAKT